MNILNISVDSSWNSAGIKDELQETEEKVGHAPPPVCHLSKAIRGQGYVHIRNAGGSGRRERI
ncbi:MAG: hypothetical protein LBR08_09040 [Bacteroidales bacterium]|jgi:hypothetical protein|nr:hypothetical protein [Bacteroidales bacterium]